MKNLPEPESRVLEFTMRDVLDGLMEATVQLLHDPTGNLSELIILSVEPPESRRTGTRAAVRRLPRRRSSDILSYLLHREQQLASSTA